MADKQVDTGTAADPIREQQLDFKFSKKTATAVPAEPTTDTSSNKKSSDSFKESASVLDKITATWKSVVSKIPKDAEQQHRDFVALATQLKATEAILATNSDKLQEAAKEDANVAKLLSVLEETKDKDVLLEKILDRQEMTVEEAAKLLSSLDSVVGALDGVDVKLDVHLSDIVENYHAQLMDSRIDVDQRKGFLKELQSIVKRDGLTGEAIHELKGINFDNYELNEDNQVKMGRLLNKVTDETADVKQTATMRELNTMMDKSILTQEELTGMMTKATASGKTMKQSFLDNPNIAALGKDVKGGILSYALGSIGLGGFGLEEIMGEAVSMGGLKRGATKLRKGGAKGAKGLKAFGKSPLSSTAKLAKSPFSFAGKGMGKGLGKLGGLGKGAGKSVGKSLGKLGGKSLLKKIPFLGLAAGGLFGAQKMFKGDIMGGLGELLSGGLSMMPGVGTAASMGVDAWLGARDMAGEDAELSGLDEIGDMSGAIPKPKPVRATKAKIGDSGENIETIAAERLQTKKTVQAASPQPLIIKQGGEKPAPLPTNRKTQIDDIDVQLFNSTMFGG